MTPTAPVAQPTIYNIQVLRGIAAMIVVCLHVQPIFESLGLFPPGGGVELSFVISGFIMTFTTRRAAPDVRRFLAQRVARIVPIYWFFTFGIFFAAIITPSLFKNTRPIISHLLLSLGFIPFAKSVGVSARPLLFVGWTLNYEMAFYLLFGLGLMFGRYGLALVVVVLAMGVALGTMIPPEAIVAAFYTSPYIILFAAGIGVALLSERGFGWLHARRWPLLLAIAVAAPPLLYGERLWPVHPAWTVGPASAVVLYAALGLERLGRTIRQPVLLRLGDASYSIYLSHPFLTVAVFNLMARLPGSALLSVATIAATLAIAGFGGWLIHRFIERPLTTAARRLLLPRRDTAAPWHGPAIT